MSKNLTRKGLALGAVVALGSSLFAGAPAFAAPALQVAPSTGTGYTVLASDAFTLKVVGNVDYTMSSASDLYWKITQPSATASVVYSGTVASGTPTAASTSTVKIIDATATATSTPNTLTITPTIASADASQAYKVQAFIESGLTAGFDANDVVASSEVTVNFVKGSELTSTVTVDQVAAALAVTGTVKYTNTDFNYAQSTLANTQVLVNLNGGTFGNAAAVTLNDDKNGFEFSNSGETVAAGSIIGVKSRVTGYNSDTTYTNSVAVYSTASAANDATAMEETISVGENIKKNGSGDYYVRTGTKSFSYRVDFTKASGVQAVAAGKPVRITVTEDSTSVATNDVIRVNGKKLTGGAASAQSAVLNTVTDAAGGITVTVESDLGLVSDKISIAVVPTGGTGTSTNAFTWTDAALTSLTLSNAQLVADKLTVVKGASVTLKYAVRDQFGKLWTKSGSNYRVAVADGNDGTLVLDTTVPVANGEATLTYTDNSTAADASVTVVAQLDVQTTGNFGDASLTDVTTNLNIVTAAQAATKLTLGAVTNNGGGTTYSDADGVATSDKVVLADGTLAALDLRSNANGDASGNTNTKAAKLTGTAYNVDGSVAAGVAVTVASAGLYFSTDATGATYMSKDSITVNANADGTYTVFALSKRGGSFAITTTAGSATKSQTVKWAAAAATAGKNITITAPSISAPGRAVDVVILLTDKYGAPVQTTTSGVERLSVAITGPGSNTAVAATTDADGKISFKLIFGANDLGTAVVKVTYDADGDTTTYSPVVVSQSIIVGAAPAGAASAAVSGSTGKFYVSATAAAGKSVVVKVAGKFVTSFKATGSKKSVAVKATKGSKKVTVFVGGKLVATKTVTVK